MSAPVPAGIALGSWAVSAPLIAASDPHKQEGRGDLNAGQQEEVPVHLAIVDVPWGKERRAWHSGQGRAPPELAAEAVWPVGGRRRHEVDSPLASGCPGSRQFPVSQLFFGGGGLKHKSHRERWPLSPNGRLPEAGESLGGPLSSMLPFRQLGKQAQGREAMLRVTGQL